MRSAAITASVLVGWLGGAGGVGAGAIGAGVVDSVAFFCLVAFATAFEEFLPGVPPEAVTFGSSVDRFGGSAAASGGSAGGTLGRGAGAIGGGGAGSARETSTGGDAICADAGGTGGGAWDGNDLLASTDAGAVLGLG